MDRTYTDIWLPCRIRILCDYLKMIGIYKFSHIWNTCSGHLKNLKIYTELETNYNKALTFLRASRTTAKIVERITIQLIIAMLH